jgi:hypothetical protein
MREGFSIRKSSVVHIITGYEPGTVATKCGKTLTYSRRFELYTDAEIEETEAVFAQVATTASTRNRG